jgi:hypothetical protein
VIIAIVAAAGGALLATWATPLSGQAPAAYRAPRAADGHADLNGIWQANTEANFDLEAHMARPALALRAGPYGPVPAAAVLALGAVGSVPPGMGVVEGGPIPYKPEALAKKEENQEKWLELDPEIKCYLPGIPRATYMPYPFQIVQSPDAILVAYEFASASRTIRMNTTDKSPVPSWMGWSRGSWEGETLVVDVTGFNDKTWFDRSGNYHTRALHVVERYTPTSANTLQYEATIEDPNVFTRPWKISMPIYRRVEPNAQLVEYKCVEFVEDLLYGHLRKKTTSE